MVRLCSCKHYSEAHLVFNFILVKKTVPDILSDIYDWNKDTVVALVIESENPEKCFVQDSTHDINRHVHALPKISSLIC
jgi:hypothetical protein